MFCIAWDSGQLWTKSRLRPGCFLSRRLCLALRTTNPTLSIVSNCPSSTEDVMFHAKPAGQWQGNSARKAKDIAKSKRANEHWVIHITGFEDLAHPRLMPSQPAHKCETQTTRFQTSAMIHTPKPAISCTQLTKDCPVSCKLTQGAPPPQLLSQTRSFLPVQLLNEKHVSEIYLLITNMQGILRRGICPNTGVYPFWVGLNRTEGNSAILLEFHNLETHPSALSR